jgi:hypothetical protein
MDSPRHRRVDAVLSCLSNITAQFLTRSFTFSSHSGHLLQTNRTGRKLARSQKQCWLLWLCEEGNLRKILGGGNFEIPSSSGAPWKACHQHAAWRALISSPTVRTSYRHLTEWHSPCLGHFVLYMELESCLLVMLSHNLQDQVFYTAQNPQALTEPEV